MLSKRLQAFTAGDLVLTALKSRLTGGFLGDVVKLSFGTLVGRLVMLAALPLLTRLYSPADFAILAVYLGLVSIITVAACLRFEVAIPLADNDTDAAHLLALALLSLLGFLGITLVPILIIPDRVANWLGNPEIAPHLWLVPLGIGVAGSYAAFQFWATRARRFGVIARTRVSQAITGVSAMLVLGWAGIAPFGLLLGNMFNIGAGGVSLGISAWRADGKLLRQIRLAVLVDTFRRYHRYPLVSTPEALLNVAGVQVPILLIAAQAGAEVGFLLLAMQIMAAPMTLLGQSISQVYVSRAPDEYRSGNLAPFTLSIMRRLLILGIGPLVLAGVLSPIVFPWIFGADWARAGEIVTWLVPWMAIQFVASPVSTVMYVVGQQKRLLNIRVITFSIRVTSVLAASWLLGEKYIVSSFAVANFIVYLGMAITFVHASRIKGGNERDT